MEKPGRTDSGNRVVHRFAVGGAQAAQVRHLPYHHTHARNDERARNAGHRQLVPTRPTQTITRETKDRQRKD